MRLNIKSIIILAVFAIFGMLTAPVAELVPSISVVLAQSDSKAKRLAACKKVCDAKFHVCASGNANYVEECVPKRGLCKARCDEKYVGD